MKRLYSRLITFISVDHPSVGLKQLPLTVVFVLSLLVLLFVPGIQITNLVMATLGIALLLVATVLSALFTARPKLERWSLVIPIIDFLAIGTFRDGTGGIMSLFGAMVVLPVVWVASEKGRRYILIAAAGTCVALILPYIMGGTEFTSASDVVRWTFAPLVYLFVASIINELARQSRSQLHAIHGLADEKERML